MNDVHDLNKYKISKELVKDYEKFLKELDFFLKVCYSFKKYKMIESLFKEAFNIRSILKSQLEHFRKVEKVKGKTEREQ